MSYDELSTAIDEAEELKKRGAPRKGDYWYKLGCWFIVLASTLDFLQ